MMVLRRQGIPFVRCNLMTTYMAPVNTGKGHGIPWGMEYVVFRSRIVVQKIEGLVVSHGLIRVAVRDPNVRYCSSARTGIWLFTSSSRVVL
jgi:hypothetical protein